jgi:hypothetical protein
MDGMGHGLPEWFNLDGRLARLQEIPIVLQFVPKNRDSSGTTLLYIVGDSHCARRANFT